MKKRSTNESCTPSLIREGWDGCYPAREMIIPHPHPYGSHCSRTAAPSPDGATGEQRAEA